MHTLTDNHALEAAPLTVDRRFPAFATDVSEKSRQTLLAIAEGLTGEPLAVRLGISRNTIQDRIRRLRLVLGCPAPFPLSELVARGYETGAVPPPARTTEEAPGLGRKEAALVPHAAAGLSFVVMAERTGIPLPVVRTTIYALRERTGAVNAPHLVTRLRELGLVTPAVDRKV
ncbi:hypothetical protein ACFWIA_30540 [Streptomyces sp. NPDC127068]|uniref:helix-turn-helix transcriptional regulator n=1 Tax=Streptomyces sp. NPDC127068 TaxID=3347127 RepID=UPI0036543714